MMEAVSETWDIRGCSDICCPCTWTRKPVESAWTAVLRMMPWKPAVSLTISRMAATAAIRHLGSILLPSLAMEARTAISSPTDHEEPFRARDRAFRDRKSRASKHCGGAVEERRVLPVSFSTAPD